MGGGPLDRSGSVFLHSPDLMPDLMQQITSLLIRAALG